IIDAIDVSSIQTSLNKGSPKTTTAIGASLTKELPFSLHKDSFSNLSLSSTTINCQQLLLLEDGDIKAAFIISTTSSCESVCSVNLRILRLFLMSSVKLSINSLSFFVYTNILHE